MSVARSILDTLGRSILVDGRPIYIRASAGVAVAPAAGATFEDALRQADVAMYEAKRRGGDEVVPYSSLYDASRSDALAMAGDLRTAMDRDELWVAYQPIVDVLSGECLKLEALARWDHPERGAISPGEFIPLAERSGLIRALGLWVLDRALGDLAAWRAAGMVPGVAVNVSMRQLGDGTLVGALLSTLERRRLPASAVTVEVTESTIMREASRVIADLTALRAAGVHIAVDDFGTGYSSLAYLHDLPIDEVKIDRSLVGAAMTNARAAIIVRDAAALAREMALSFVAEGIDDERTLAFIGTLPGVWAQGFLIGRPMRTDALPAWLAGHRARTRLSKDGFEHMQMAFETLAERPDGSRAATLPDP